ncbi:MAG: hypothetical protein LBP88_04485 [Treponema sp.]|nr:hypothetical protein [Treponema sp.]
MIGKNGFDNTGGHFMDAGGFPPPVGRGSKKAGRPLALVFAALEPSQGSAALHCRVGNPAWGDAPACSLF